MLVHGALYTVYHALQKLFLTDGLLTNLNTQITVNIKDQEEGYIWIPTRNVSCYAITD